MSRESRLVNIVERGSIPSHVARPYDFSDEEGPVMDLLHEIKDLWPLPGILSSILWTGLNWNDIWNYGPESRFYPFISPDTLDRKPILEQAWPFIEFAIYGGAGLVLGGLGYLAIQHVGQNPLKIRKEEKRASNPIREWVKQSTVDIANMYRGIETLAGAGYKKRRVYTEYHNRTVIGLKDKVKKEPLSQLNGAILDYLTNSYGDSLERVDRIMGKRQTYSHDRVENAEYYRVLAKLMRSIAQDSRFFAGKAIRRETWFIEQMYLDASSDDRTKIDKLTDSKHDVRIIHSPHIPTDEIIKRYRGDDPAMSQLGEIRFSREILEICDDEKTAPRLLSAMKLIGDGEEYVSIYSLLKGETLYDMIGRLGGGHPQVLIAAEQIMDFMGLIYGKIPTDGLSRRDHGSYIYKGMEKAKVLGLLSGLDLDEMMIPIDESEKRGIQVICKDPHAGNWGKLKDGRIASYDNERTHTISLAGEVAKFYLFAFDPRYDASPGRYDDPVYAEDVNLIIDSFNERSAVKARWDEEFFTDIKNFEILQGISLYSPYTLRLVMREKKRDILFKARDAIELISGEFRDTVYKRHKNSYEQMDTLVDRMITRNGF